MKFTLVLLALSLSTALTQAQASEPVLPSVGSCYGGGVVFYVNPNHNAPAGSRGLIMALTDALQNEPVVWDSNFKNNMQATEVLGTSPSFFSGYMNTQAIIHTDNNSYAWPAAQAAIDYNTLSHASCPGQSCTDWFLPSQDELIQLYLSSRIPDFANQCSGYIPPKKNYWSSTEYQPKTAFEVNFSLGTAHIAYLNAELFVRPVRAF